ncbi:hypothetical protein BJF79_13580 [Actinomadura sp. CNU-125]|uniref:hypothetical protein n=1 Tax=Actinomadura sp. CNU-125 TaxID=1904961 RepID=UPI000959C3BE|nr:hypothetical protein [Actinomadura sp. CNU-125]OLT24368.1 hypothetical protein BJF79_13580 [Actinomadura sp. CNU-125]
MTEPRYTLDEAATELARRECFTDGHDFTVTSTGVQLAGGGDEPVSVHCDRCHHIWTVRPLKETQ